MNKLLKPVLLSLSMLTLLLFLNSCPGKKLDLQLNLNKDNIFVIDYLLEAKITKIINGNYDETNQKLRIVYTLTVKEIKEDKTAIAEIKLDSFYIKQTSADYKFEYDSTNPKSEIVPPIALNYYVLLGEKIEISLLPNGKIKEIKGMDRVLEKMLTEVSNQLPSELSEKDKQIILNDVKNKYEQNNMKNSLEMIWKVYPDKKVGKKYSNSQEVFGLFPVTIKNNYEVISIKDGLINLESESEIVLNEALEPESSKQQFTEFFGTETGTCSLYEDTRMIQEADFHQEFEGKVKLTEPISTTFPLRSEADIKIRMLRLK